MLSLQLSTLRPRQDGHYFADDVLKCIFFNENVWISLKIPLMFVPWGPLNNVPALVQIMAWHWPGDKPSSELMLVFVPTHICITLPQWVKKADQKATQDSAPAVKGLNWFKIFYKLHRAAQFLLNSGFGLTAEKLRHFVLITYYLGSPLT